MLKLPTPPSAGPQPWLRPPRQPQPQLGNVWEWTCSAYDSDYDGAEQRCANANDSGSRVLRGGSWSSDPRWVRSADRSGFTADARNYFLGFRLAQD